MCGRDKLSRADAEAAVRTLIEWAGDDPDREGLVDTPDRVVGISKLARVIEVFAKRLQIQETLTAQIAETIQTTLQPRGVGVVIEAAHQCMTTRGVRKPGVSMVTSHMLGSFRDDPITRQEFLSIIRR